MQELIEGWKPIKDYEGLYEISSFGRISSFYGKNIEKILKLGIDNSGHFFVGLYKDKKVKTYVVALLVWDHFGDKPRNGRKLEVAHIKNKLIDRIDNLQLLTHREIVLKGYRIKKTSSKYAGVHWNKRDRKWRADIRIDGTKKFLGNFREAIEASDRYQEALVEIESKKDK